MTGLQLRLSERGTPSLVAADSDSRALEYMAGIAAALVIVLLIIIYALIPPHLESPKAKRFVEDLAIGLMVVPGVFLAQLLLRPLQDARDRRQSRHLVGGLIDLISIKVIELGGAMVHPVWRQIRWDEEIVSATTLKVTHPFLREWFSAGGDRVIEDCLAKAKGRVEFVICDPDVADRELSRFADYQDVETLSGIIRMTLTNLQSFFIRDGETVKRRGRMEVYLTRKYMMHGMIIVDDRLAYFCLFDHFRSKQHRGLRQSSTFVVDLEKQPDVKKWALDEFEAFKALQPQVFSSRAPRGTSRTK